MPAGRSAVEAWEEVETWILAGFDDLPSLWRDIRVERQVKERFYAPYAEYRKVATGVAGGRKILTAEALRHWGRMPGRCPKDLGHLVQRLRRL